MRAKAEDFGTAMWPHQTAVSIHNGASILTQGLQLLMEQHPEWAIIKLDVTNAFNEVSRDAVLKALAAEPELRDCVPLFHAFMVDESAIVLYARRKGS